MMWKQNYGILGPAWGPSLSCKAGNAASPPEPALPVGRAMTDHSHNVAASAHKPAPGGLSIHPALLIASSPTDQQTSGAIRSLCDPQNQPSS